MNITKRILITRSDNSEFMSAYDTDETIEKLKFLVQKYQVDLETSMNV